ncbi:recombinase family protein [Micromonospora sp. SD19]
MSKKPITGLSDTLNRMTASTSAPDDPLAQARPSGVLVGYGRVSTREQNLARQEAALTAAGCARCFFDKASGKNADRPELARMFDYVRPGDALIVVSLDRLGRSLEDLIAIVGRLKRQGVGFLSLHEKLDTTTAGGMFVFHVFAALAEFIRTIIVANTNEGLAAARARGQRLGRPPAMTPEKLAYARQLLAEPDRSISAIAKLVGVSRSTIYKALPELLPPQLAQHRLAAQIALLPADTRKPPSNSTGCGSSGEMIKSR